MSWDYLAYVDDNYGDIYLPFSFCDTWNRLGYGCNMPTGAEAHSADGHHQLTYELEGDRLHVYGKVLTRGSLNNYAYFIEEQSDDSSVRKLHFKIQAIGPIPDPLPGSDGLYLHTSDFYVEGLDPNMNYIVVDSQGEEYPVVNKTAQMPYHPFVEDGKVWKVGYGSDNPIQYVEYYYFDSDTIVDGKTCKQMMSQRYVTPDYADYEAIMRLPLLRRNGVWYEEDKKVYVYDDTNKQFILWYDFSLDAYAPLWLAEYAPPYVLGPRQTGGIKGFKGVHRDVMISAEGEYHYNITWLEGVGSIEGPVYNVYYGKEYHGGAFLMSCTVGDEVIYLNDEYEDGATPAEARKRFDFTHTVKTKPKAPRRAMLGDGCFVMGVGARATSPAEAELSLYGEYNEQQLGIHLDPLDDAYQVRITDETGKAVYEKAVNAGNIVGLNIDISAYAEGRYTVTMENSQEAFTGLFEVQTTGISDAERLNNNEEMINESIYNLQGQRISSLKKGMNIVNGQKVYVK
jgi:hypothetical protein